MSEGADFCLLLGDASFYSHTAGVPSVSLTAAKGQGYIKLGNRSRRVGRTGQFLNGWHRLRVELTVSPHATSLPASLWLDEEQLFFQVPLQRVVDFENHLGVSLLATEKSGLLVDEVRVGLRRGEEESLVQGATLFADSFEDDETGRFPEGSGWQAYLQTAGGLSLLSENDDNAPNRKAPLVWVEYTDVSMPRRALRLDVKNLGSCLIVKRFSSHERWSFVASERTFARSDLLRMSCDAVLLIISALDRTLRME